MPENQRERKWAYVYSLNSVTSQFNTLELSAKSKENKCPHCSKIFLKPSGLKAHIFSHTGEKPHKCPVANCDRYFSLLSNLRRHIKIHNKENKTKDRVPTPKKSTQKIRPLLPAGSASHYQHDDGDQMDQGQQCHSNHGTMPSQGHAYFHRMSLTSMEGEGFVLANNSGNICDMKLGTTSTLLNDYPMSSLAASNFYLPFDSFQLPTTQENLEDLVGQFQTPSVVLEHLYWSTLLPDDPLFSIEYLNCSENFNNKYTINLNK